MARTPDEEVTFYFVLIESDGRKQIKAWSEDKAYVEFYMKFHTCKAMSVKKMQGYYGDIVNILNENLHDEIHMYNILIKNPDVSKRKKHPVKQIAIPATDTEIMYVNDEINSFLSTRIDYRFIEACLPLLKGKYTRALHDCLLIPILEKVMHEKNSPIVSSLQEDQLGILTEAFSEQFGL